MKKELQIDSETFDLRRFDDPLFAEPRAGLSLPGGIFARMPSSLGDPRPFRLRFEPEGLPAFASKKELVRCAEEIIKVLARYDIKAELLRK